MPDEYRVLLLTSMPGSEHEITAVAAKYFNNVTVLYWEMGNSQTKSKVLAAIDDTDYNLIISYLGGIILTSDHLDRASFGAINIHPSPPEHGGCWGCWCQPIVNPETRTHHGVTVHEIDEKIDHGPIYIAERWEVGREATIQNVMERSVSDSTRMLEIVCQQISNDSKGTKCFTPTDERWHPTNKHTPIAEIRKWFAALPADHPAHKERVFLNHPRAIISPPYFDDV